MEKTKFENFGSLVPKKIISVESTLGYLQVLEYTLQDSFSCSDKLCVVQWHKNHIMHEEGVPVIYNKVFYGNKNGALKFAHDIANELLEQYD